MGAAGAFALGLLTQSSLLFAGLLACRVRIPTRVVGLLAGFGAGAMLSAISFDLVAEASRLSSLELGVWMLVGAGAFLAGSRIVEGRFGREGTGPAMAIVVGSVVDGVPESLVLGIQLATGLPMSIGFVAAVVVSNVAEAIAPSAELSAAGWSARRVGRIWLLVVLACASAAALGYLAAEEWGATGDHMAAIAAGGLLAMLTDSLIPFAYERARDLAGVAAVVGFCLSLILS